MQPLRGVVQAGTLWVPLYNFFFFFPALGQGLKLQLPLDKPKVKIRLICGILAEIKVISILCRNKNLPEGRLVYLTGDTHI